MTAFPTRELSEEDVSLLTTANAGVDQQSIVVRPHKDNSGIPGMDEVLRSLPRADTESGRLGRTQRNVSTPFAFEMQYTRGQSRADQRVISLQYVGGDDTMSALLERQIADKYPDSRTEVKDPRWLHPEPGQHMAAATLGLRRYTLYPLKNVELDSFGSDPTGSILTEMVGAAEAGGVDADVGVQIMVRPVPNGWKQGVPNAYGVADSHGDGLSPEEEKVTNPLSAQKLRHFLNQPTYEKRPILPTPIGSLLGYGHSYFRDEFKHPPSKADKEAARMLSDLDGRGWEIHIRIVAVSEDPELASERVASTATMFDNFYEYRGAQTFIPAPKSGGETVETAVAAASRTWPEDRLQRIVKPQIEIAGLVNIPKAEDVSTNKLRWAISKPGDGVPPGTPRFEFEAHGLDRSTATREETQVAMLDASDGGESEPLWLGTGVKHGTEAGVFGDKLIHQFIGGTTGMGKTTYLTNYAAQCYRGEGGGLVVDPKGVDADEFLAEWPHEFDPEDIIVMDLTDEFEEIPRFNFLEIPEYLEPGSRAFNSYTEALADDVTAMVAEAGGTDKYLGALMKRTVRAAVRGLAKMDATTTLLDLAAVCSSSENLDKFRQHMEEEHYQNLMETAESLAQKDDTDFEPLSGRMDEWVLNENIRDLICARESSFSIDNMVTDGKWLVVRCKPSGAETEASMLGTALIRRTYFAQRHLRPDHSFDLICDEFDNIASEQSNIHKILSEARAFDYRCTLASQAPTNQFPDRVMHSIENQCGTFISFNPGGSKDARWISNQHTADKEELLNLARYKFYMRTTTRDDELTRSYMVEGFPPVRESRPDARTDAEIHDLKQASLDVYGEPVKSEAELRSESPYLSGRAAVDGDGSEEETAEEWETALCKAVHDAALREEGDGLAWVTNDSGTVTDRLTRYTGEEWTVSQFGALAETSEGVEYRDTEHGIDLRCTDAGRSRFLPAGSNQTEGGLSHRSILKDAYTGLTRLGVVVELPEQGGGAEVDGVGRIRETFDPDIDPHTKPTEFAEAASQFAADHPILADLTAGNDITLEAESSTSGKPAATCENLAKAVADGKRCVFLARPENADAVANTLTDPAYLHNTPGEADRRFYNRKNLVIDGEHVLRPGGAEQTVWKEYDGTIVLEDNEGREHARFDSPNEVHTHRSAYPAHTGEVPEEDIGRGEKWRLVSRPWIPEREFSNGEVPDRDSWRLLIVGRDRTLTRFSDGKDIYHGDGENTGEGDTRPEEKSVAEDGDVWGELEEFVQE